MPARELQAIDDLSLEAIAALERAKSAFLGAHAERCTYLRVAFEPNADAGELAVAARFTIGPVREWHSVEASIKLTDLEHGSDPRPPIDRAFQWLTDGVATVGIARLFRPQGEAGPDPA